MQQSKEKTNLHRPLPCPELNNDLLLVHPQRQRTSYHRHRPYLQDLDLIPVKHTLGISTLFDANIT